MTRRFDDSTIQESVLDDIAIERLRQDHLRDEGKFSWTLADAGAYAPSEGLVVLGEEFGEVSRVVCESLGGKRIDTAHLREELIQLAACCVAWAEAIDLAADDAPEETAHTHPDWSGVPHFPEEEDYGLYAGAPQVGDTP